MSERIDFSSVTLLSEMRGDSDADTKMIEEMAVEAEKFIRHFEWCEGIKEAYFGCGVGGIVGVFFFRIIPTREAVDEYLWAIVGDLPPAYIVTDESRTPFEALRAYIAEMQQWVSAAEAGQSVKELIPVNISPTRENALILRARLDFLLRVLLS